MTKDVRVGCRVGLTSKSNYPGQKGIVRDYSAYTGGRCLKVKLDNLDREVEVNREHCVILRNSEFQKYERVYVNLLGERSREGVVTDIVWDTEELEFKYKVECKNNYYGYFKLSQLIRKSDVKEGEIMDSKMYQKDDLIRITQPNSIQGYIAIIVSVDSMREALQLRIVSNGGHDRDRLGEQIKLSHRSVEPFARKGTSKHQAIMNLYEDSMESRRSQVGITMEGEYKSVKAPTKGTKEYRDYFEGTNSGRPVEWSEDSLQAMVLLMFDLRQDNMVEYYQDKLNKMREMREA